MDHTDKPSWRHGWGRMLAWMLAGVLVAALVIFVSEQQSDAADIECSMSECPTVKKRHNKAARLYKEGETGRSDGFKPKKMFAKPRAAKRIFGRRIGAVMKRQAEAAAARQGISAQEVPVPGDCQDWRCAGIREYKRLTDHAGCVDRDPAIFPPDEESCAVQDWRSPITKNQVIKGGKVMVCAGEFVIAVRLRTEKFGQAVAAATGINCTFTLWDMLD